MMRKFDMSAILSMSFLILVIGCKNETGELSKEKDLVSGIKLENMDTLVKPGDDFMAYVNGAWLKNTEIPSDKSSYGIAYMLYEESQENVKKIIEESAAGDFAKGSDEQKVGDLYASYMNMEKRNEIGIAPLKEGFDKIDAIADYDDLAVYFAYANKFGIEAPIALSVSLDFKNPTIYTVYTEQSGLGLPDREYYLKKDDRSKELRAKYVEHIEKMHDLTGLEDGENKSRAIMALETRLAEQHLEKEKVRDLVSLYNMFPVDTLQYIMPNFNWEGYLKEAGVDKQEKIGVLMLDYHKALDGIITSTDLDTWKTYLKWSLIRTNGARLNEEVDNQNFEFYGKELYGIPEQRPQWRRAVSTVNSNLGEVVGKVYVKRHFPPEAKQKMDTLVGNLLKAYEVSIKELDWMTEDTREEALDKLSKFRAKIGYPSKWKEYNVDIQSDDLFGNLQSSALMEYNRDLEKLGKPVDKEEWAMNPQTLNAYYRSTMNEIVFPAAILQPPFFDMDADDAVNYGAIGAIIGHEIGHGFDDKGSTFDGDGAMRNWWTDQDRKEFDKRTSVLVEQYNQYQVFPDLIINGEFTLGENIGDLGGLGIALKAYKMSLAGQEPEVMDGFTGEQRVFIGYAQAFMGKAREDALRVQINTDPHSPKKFRVNGVVRNIPEFYTAFNVQPSDSLYLAPENRVRIW